MTTLHSAIQTLVNNLQTKMNSNTPLNPEEQILVASAIEKLSSQANLERALVAVATEHLSDAKTALTDALVEAKTTVSEELAEAKQVLSTEMDDATSTLTSSLTNAQQTLTTALNSAEATLSEEVTQVTGTLASAETAINTAKTTLQTESQRMVSIGDNLQGNMQAFTKENILLSQRSLPRPVFASKNIETVSTSSHYQRGQAIFAVYDASGETYAVRPSYLRNSTQRAENMLQFLKLSVLGNSATSLRTHYLHSSFHASPSTWIYQYGAVAMLPLASKTNSSAITYEQVYSTQNTSNNSSSYYQGVYCRRAGYGSATKPKQNMNAQDQWGITTDTSYHHSQCGVLYDNIKHCLVMVDTSSRVIEKYADGNLTTSKTISNATQYQQFVNAGDFTVVHFISVCLPWPDGDKLGTPNISMNKDGRTDDFWGYFGLIDGQLKMGGEKHSAHYRFTDAKKLEPLVYRFHTSVTEPNQDGAVGDIRVALATMNNETLGIYHFQIKTNAYKNYTGYLGNALMCMNPYSHVGIFNEYYNYSGSHWYCGIGRTCKAL